MTPRNALPSLRVLGIIPARGGSKGVPRKNIRTLSGRPLIYYTIAACLKSERLTDFVLTSEDREILDIAQSLGCPVLERPQELALDETPSLPVIQHALIEQEKQCNDRYDAICLLQPTNPLRIASDIDGAVELLTATGADSVISFTPVGERHPARMKTIDADGRVHDPEFAEAFEGQRRQELAPFYLRDGSIYLTRRDVLVNQHSLKGDDCRAWIIPPERARNIDEPLDIFFVTQLMRLDPEKYPGQAFSLQAR